MKNFGAILAAVGAVIAIYGFSMDTTRGSIHNIGLLQDSQNALILGGVLFLGGLILFGFGSSQENQSGRDAPASPDAPKTHSVIMVPIRQNADGTFSVPAVSKVSL